MLTMLLKNLMRIKENSMSFEKCQVLYKCMQLVQVNKSPF